MAGAVGPASSLRETIEGLVAVSFDTFQSDPRWAPLFMEFWVQALRDAYARDIVAGSLRQCRDLLGGMLRIGQDGGVVRSDLDIEAAATLLVGVLDGVVLQWTVDPEGVDITRLHGPTVDLIQRFIEAEGAADLSQEDIPGLKEALVTLLEQHEKDQAVSGADT